MNIHKGKGYMKSWDIEQRQVQCSARKFQNWGQCPTTFEKVGTF